MDLFLSQRSPETGLADSAHGSGSHSFERTSASPWLAIERAASRFCFIASRALSTKRVFWRPILLRETASCLCESQIFSPPQSGFAEFPISRRQLLIAERRGVVGSRGVSADTGPAPAE